MAWPLSVASSSQVIAKESWYTRAVITAIDSSINQLILLPLHAIPWPSYKVELRVRPGLSSWDLVRRS